MGNYCHDIESSSHGKISLFRPGRGDVRLNKALCKVKLVGARQALPNESSIFRLFLRFLWSMHLIQRIVRAVLVTTAD